MSKDDVTEAKLAGDEATEKSNRLEQGPDSESFEQRVSQVVEKLKEAETVLVLFTPRPQWNQPSFANKVDDFACRNSKDQIKESCDQVDVSEDDLNGGNKDFALKEDSPNLWKSLISSLGVEPTWKWTLTTKWAWKLAPRTAWTHGFLEGALGPPQIPSPMRCVNLDLRKEKETELLIAFPAEVHLGQLEENLRVRNQGRCNEKPAKELSFTVVTTAMHGAHQEARSSQVIELYGSTRRFCCVANGHAISKVIDFQTGRVSQEQPCCAHTSCKSLARPDCVLFGEDVCHEDLARAQLAAAHLNRSKGDVCIVVGEPDGLYPASYLPEIAARNAALVVLLAPSKTSYLAVLQDVISNMKSPPLLLHLPGSPAEVLANISQRVLTL